MRTKREKVLRARVSDELYKRIDELALSSGACRSDTIRQVLSSGRAVSVEELRSLRRSINAIGCNCNQLARQANQSGHDASMYSSLKEIIIEFRNMIERFRSVANEEKK